MKIAIGCLIQWYEVNIIEQYFHSVREAIRYAKAQNPNLNIVVYNEVDTSTFIEQPVTDTVVSENVNKIKDLASKYDFTIAKIQGNFYPYSISEFRHDFNSNFCRAVDVLVWGESDMIAPLEMFALIGNLFNSVAETKWIATFASCKMWDTSWKVLEHPAFTDRVHSDSKNDWWSVNYDMSYEEMLNINSTNGSATVVNIRSRIGSLKFNGCGLVLTSDIIKAGLNVPLAAFFVHEDTAFMNLLDATMPKLKQYHFSDILLVHNRKHSLKRSHIFNETGTTVGQRRKSNPVYVQANTLSQENVNNLFSTAQKFNTWKEVKQTY